MSELEKILKLFSYDPITGIVTKNSTGKEVTWGSRASGQLRETHVLAFILHNKRMPTGVVDHRNGNKKENKPNNLRDATHRQNMYNRPSQNGVEVKGVTYCYWCKRPWRAKIKLPNGKHEHLGLFATEEEAAAAYRKAAEELQGEFAYHNRQL